MISTAAIGKAIDTCNYAFVMIKPVDQMNWVDSKYVSSVFFYKQQVEATGARVYQYNKGKAAKDFVVLIHF